LFGVVLVKQNGSRNRASACIVCGVPAPEPILEISDIVVETSRLWSTREYAEAAQMRNLELGFCTSCGHVFNLTFDPTAVEYDHGYEASQMFSPRFRAYADGLADALIQSHGIFEKRVMEIGGGKGDFLRLMCEKASNEGINIDPGAPLQSPAGDEALTHIAAYYGDEHVGLTADLVITRHTLEHIWQPAAFVRQLRRAIGNRRVPVYIEVPNMEYILRENAVFELIYPHCSYYTRNSLMRLCGNAGFEVLELRDEFEGQFLGAWLSPRVGTGSRTMHMADIEELSSAVRTFARRFAATIRHTQERLAACGSMHQRVVMWGAGAKAVTLTNLADKGRQIEYLVDVNPRKVGTFMPKTAQAIVEPSFLRESAPDVVMLTNAAYESEIRQELEHLGIAPEVELV
jgi:hypothetical protein